MDIVAAYIAISVALMTYVGITSGMRGTSRADTTALCWIALLWPLILIYGILYALWWLPFRGPYRLGQFIAKRRKK